jgi:hypothetical protein
MTLKIQTPKHKNLYILFGWEAIEARPNLDPYQSTLRMDPHTQQVYTTDVHLKHHVRRGMRSVGERLLGAGRAQIFYEKKDAEGRTRSFDTRIKAVREAFGITSPGPKDAYEHCLDLPLFGYVHAVDGENFNAVNAANVLFRPSTFHACRILSLGKNNAFSQKNKGGDKDKEASGSSTSDVLEYGFFLALWEVNLEVLAQNAKSHKVIAWKEDGQTGWLELLINGMWVAYTGSRYSSITQRAQFANFLLAWSPEAIKEPRNPKNLIEALGENPEIEAPSVAHRQLRGILPGFLDAWGYTPDGQVARRGGQKILA